MGENASVSGFSMFEEPISQEELRTWLTEWLVLFGTSDCNARIFIERDWRSGKLLSLARKKYYVERCMPYPDYFKLTDKGLEFINESTQPEV